MVKEIETIDEFKEAIGDETSGLVVIDFFAEWCGPCKRIAPIFEKFSQKYPNVGFYKIDSDRSELSEIINACQVSSLPTFCFFLRGKYVTKFIGANEDKLESLIVQYMPKRNAD